MNSNAYVFPVELWEHIFSLACLDDGSTGRSLSLVSTHFRAISAPFKYRSIAITHWSQIIAFSQFFCKLPASQKKTVSLFVHLSYPFLDVSDYSSPTTGTDQTSEQGQSEDDFESSEESEDIQEIRDASTLPECNDVLEVLDVESHFAGDWTSDFEGGSDRSGSNDGPWVYSDGIWDSEFEGSFDSKESTEILEDVEYLEAVRDGLLPPEGNTRDDILRDADIEAFFDNVLQAFRDVLNEISSTLQLLAVYWTSFKPLQIHELLSPLPCLVELHMNRSSTLKRDIYEDPPTTVLFPRLLSLYISGDNPRKPSFSGELARIAPNLTSLRFSMDHFYPKPGDLEGPKHDFYFHVGGIIIESDNCSELECRVAERRFKREFGEFKYAVEFYLADVYEYDSPEIWQKWWTNQMVGNDDGPWSSLNHVMRIEPGCQYA